MATSKEKEKQDKLAKFGLQMADMVTTETQLEGFDPLDLTKILAVMVDKMFYPLPKIDQKQAWRGYFTFLASLNRTGRSCGLPIREAGVIEIADFFRSR